LFNDGGIDKIYVVKVIDNPFIRMKLKAYLVSDGCNVLKIVVAKDKK
jgi:hypothetical protein